MKSKAVLLGVLAALLLTLGFGAMWVGEGADAPGMFIIGIAFISASAFAIVFSFNAIKTYTLEKKQ